MNGDITLGRGQANPLENYKKGARVWIRDPELVWIGAELLTDVTFATKLINLRLENGEDRELPVTSAESLPFLRNPDILLGSDDLTTLSYLHEPAVLSNLSYRFMQREAIYTYCGIVLVAINPYADCSQLYSDEVIQVYRGAGNQVRELDPHIYAVAEEAFFNLSEYHQNQSIIVSGESGAGKTVSAKFVMRYFASVAGSPRKPLKSRLKDGAIHGETGIERRVLASNPIMEAIGNAKTIRNDNSSRFGKFIQINLTDKLTIAGAQMRTYLLEKSRVVFQAYNERNYHIFYQMCASQAHPLLNDLNLGDCESYFYTAQGGDGQIDGMDDCKDFLETMAAFDLLGVSHDVQRAILRTFVGLLLLGNIDFEEPEGNDEIVVIKQSSRKAISQLCSQLYDINENDLRLWLTCREIRAAGEVLRKPLNYSAAIASRDALAKKLYESTFTWIVKRVNDALIRHTSDPRSKNSAPTFVGVLDIYGFETFEVNSFEQFCINYANEKLQQQFCQHVFKLEQSEYEREEIAWVRVDFYDNQPCIDLIEGKLGLIDYLDEQCKMGRGTDLDWLEMLRNCSKLKKSEHFQLPRIKNPSFIVRHFAADVVYLVDGFLEKNKDTVSEQLIGVMRDSKMKFLHEVVAGESQEPKPARTGLRSLIGGSKKTTNNKKCVSFQFRDSLSDLMTVLGETRPHYVRCIKPNDQKMAYTFEPQRAIQQLRACGVLETVRISAAGYPSRWPYDDFGRRYRVLHPDGKALWRNNPKKFAEKACERHVHDGMFALGKTKVFFRTGQVALLERLRQEKLSVSVIIIQKIWRGFAARRRYQHMRQSIIIIQAYTRAFLAYRRMKYLQMHRAAICIQTTFRRYIAQKRYTMARTAVLMIQTHFRGSLARKKVEKLRYEQKAIVIQKHFRGWMVRKQQIERNRNIIKVQCQVRKWLAKRRLTELKIEARSVGHLQKLNTGLENKIISLQQRLDVMTADNTRLLDISHRAETMRAEMAILESDRSVLASAKARVDELEQEVERLETECDVRDAQIGELQTRRNQMNSKMEQKDSESEQKIRTMEDEMTSLRKKCDDLMKQKKNVESELSIESEKRMSAEQELSQMRDQLLANANLLASPSLSRVGSMRSSQRGSDQNMLSLPGADGQSITVGTGSGDLDQVALILKQQHMINELRTKLEQNQRENERLKAMMNANSMIESLDKRTSIRAFETQRVQELELAYSKMKSELDRLIDEKAESGYEGMNFRSMFEKTIEENDRRREESAELRALLASRFERHTLSRLSPRPDSGHWSSAPSDDDVSLSDLDEELCLERQCRQLKAHIETLTRAITERNQEIERLENRLNESIPFTRSASDEGRPVEETISNIHQHLNHLANENLSLQSKLNRQADELTEARAQLRGYSGSLGYSLDNASDSEIIRLEALTKETVEHSSLLEVFNVPEFTRILVLDLKPRLARLLTPCLPAYLLLAAFRYHDHAKDEAGLTGLFSAVHVVLKDTVSRSNDMDVLALWLVNSWRLFNLLRQYSGENNNEWFAGNTEKQSSQRMQSFDLAPIRDQLRARVEECFQNIMKRSIEPVLSPKIVPGILQHETSQDLMANGITDNSSKGSSSRAHKTPQKALDDLLELLNFIYTKLKVYGADAVLLSQVFGQMTYWICALALNHLMFRKELCNFEKAIQIKHNVTEIQSWLFARGLGSHRETLEPLVQASHLLQSKKDESNLDTLCGEMTSKLMPKQVIAILQHYAPSDGFEERRLEPDFLIKVNQRLLKRLRATGGTDEDQNTLIMMGTYLKPFDSEAFIHSDFPLETLSLPTCLHLQAVCRLL